MRLIDKSSRNMASDRPQHDVRIGLQVPVGGALGDHVPPRRGGQGHRQAEEGQRSLDDDHPGHGDQAEGDRHRYHVGEDLAEDDPRVELAPIVRAATTKSRLAKDRLEARTTRYRSGMVATPRMMVIFSRVAPQKATMAITATMAGKARRTKDPALRAMSSRPPL